ncbi:hypothetical protein LTR28_000302, partial [Elasticomyces elasticus]
TELDELEALAPNLSREDSSPQEADWDAINKELEDFMDGEDDSESDAESIVSVSSRDSSSTAIRTPPSQRKRKRKRAEEGAETAEEGEGTTDGEDAQGSELQKRRKKALDRSTSLANVASTLSSPGAKSGSLMVPEDPGGGGGDSTDDEDAALAAELEAEMARQDEEEEEANA